MTKTAFFRTVFAGALLVGSVFTGWLAVKQREIQSWVPTDGEVVEVWTQKSTWPPLHGKYMTTPPREVTEHWIKYSYQVGGRAYFGEATSISSKGAGFKVYYDPDHPEASSIFKPKGESPYLLAVCTAVQFLAAIVLGPKS